MTRADFLTIKRARNGKLLVQLHDRNNKPVAEVEIDASDLADMVIKAGMPQ